jgi:Kef-type K+ transport system membrane component KefB
LAFLTWMLSVVGGGSDFSQRAQNTVILGFVILAAHALGLLARLSLPAITAHLILGVAAGPHGLGIITLESIANFRLIDGIALALIALTAGGELVIKDLRPAFHSIGALTLSLTVFVFLVASGVTWLMLDVLPEASRPTGNSVTAFCLLMGVMAVALSPSATIAVITESRAKGRLTDVILGVTVLLDVLVIVLFAAVFSFSQSLLSSDSPEVVRGMAGLLVKLAISVALGLGLAAAMALALPRAGKQIPVLIAGFSLIVAAAAPLFGLDALILCIATGFAVRNFTSRGREMIVGIERISPLFYAIFFTLVSAGLDFHAVGRIWPFAAALIVARLLATYVASHLATHLAGSRPLVRRLSWLGFVSQAGVSLGLATIVATTFTQWGRTFQTLVITLTAGNLFIGPILLRLALVRAGEAQSPAPNPAERSAPAWSAS